MSTKSDVAYRQAQQAMAELKAAIRSLLDTAGDEGLRNVDIGKTLGIYAAHHEQHVGHIPRTLLALMREEGVVDQDPDTGRWKLVEHEDG